MYGGTPTQEEAVRRIATNIPYRTWYPACLAGRARGHHRWKQRREREKRVPEAVSDDISLGVEGRRETVAVLVIRGRRISTVFARVVPMMWLAHDHGSQDLPKDLQKLGYHGMMLKCDGEPAPRIAQESGTARPSGRPKGMRRPWGDALGMEAQLRLKVRSAHPKVSWMLEHTADVLSKQRLETTVARHTSMKGNPCSHEKVGIGENIHYMYPARRHEGTLGRVLLGKGWRKGDAIVGTLEGEECCDYQIREGHRKWDAEGIVVVRGRMPVINHEISEYVVWRRRSSRAAFRRRTRASRIFTGCRCAARTSFTTDSPMIALGARRL